MMKIPPFADGSVNLKSACDFLKSTKLDEQCLPDGSNRCLIVDAALTILSVLDSSGDTKLSSDSHTGAVDQAVAVGPDLSSVAREENSVITLTTGTKLYVVLHLIGEMIKAEIKAAGDPQRKLMLHAAELVLRNHPEVTPRPASNICVKSSQPPRLREFVKNLEIETDFGKILVLNERWNLEEKKNPAIRGSAISFFMDALTRNSGLQWASVNAGLSKEQPQERLQKATVKTLLEFISDVLDVKIPNDSDVKAGLLAHWEPILHATVRDMYK